MKSLVIVLSVAAGLLGASFTFKSMQDKKPWPVPDNYKGMKNAVASNVLFNKY